MTGGDGVAGSLEGRSPTLFLVAGGLVVVFAGLLGLEAFADTTAPEDVFGPAGFAVAYVGLLGLYPGLADRTPWLARAGAVFAAVGVVGASVIAMGSLGTFLGVLSGEQPTWTAVFVLGLGVGMVPGFVTFGVASLRAGVHSRTLGFLLLAPPGIFAVMLSGQVHLVVDDALANFLLASGQALSHLAIGAVLHAEGVPTDRAEPTADATV